MNPNVRVMVVGDEAFVEHIMLAEGLSRCRDLAKIAFGANVERGFADPAPPVPLTLTLNRKARRRSAALARRTS